MIALLFLKHWLPKEDEIQKDKVPVTSDLKIRDTKALYFLEFQKLEKIKCPYFFRGQTKDLGPYILLSVWEVYIFSIKNLTSWPPD